MSNTPTGLPANQDLLGTDSEDSVTGWDGNDTLVGLAGNDLLAGGAGTDVARYLGNQSGYRLAALADGRLSVTDTHPANGDEGTDILESVEQLSFADGQMAVSVLGGKDLQVNATSVEHQYNPSSTRLSQGGYVTVWQSPDGSGDGIFAQRFSAGGVKLGAQIRINSGTESTQSFSDDEVALKSVAALPDGGFVVAWRSTGSDGISWGVVAQRFDAGGVAVGSEIKVNTTTGGEQRDPSKFVVVWMDANG